MPRKILIPSSFSLCRRRNTFLILRDDYKDLLLREGIEDIEAYIRRNLEKSTVLQGRTLHPSIPIGNEKRMVIRQYSHGGLLRGLTGSLYFSGSRSFEELALTEEIRSSGIPTIQPIGAIHQTVIPPFYRAYLLSLEIPEARDLIRLFVEIGPGPSRDVLSHKRTVIRSTGILLRDFHKAGFFHRDLQLKNILVSGSQPLLIDFDQSYRNPVLSLRERMKNLLRLNRSAEKWIRLGLPITWRDRLRFFSIYAGNDIEIRNEMRRASKTYSLRALLHRIGWALEGNPSITKSQVGK